MRMFKIGDRVRIKFSIGWPILAGEAGTIVGRSRTKGVDGVSEWLVAPDCWGTYFAPFKGVNGSSKFAPSSCQLEPLTPPHESCESEFKESLDQLLGKLTENA